MSSNQSTSLTDSRPKPRRRTFYLLSTLGVLVALAGALILPAALRTYPTPPAIRRMETPRKPLTTKPARIRIEAAPSAKVKPETGTARELIAISNGMDVIYIDGANTNPKTETLTLVDDETVRQVMKEYGIPEGKLIAAAQDLPARLQEKSVELNKEFELAKRMLVNEILLMPDRDLRQNTGMLDGANARLEKLAFNVNYEAYAAFHRQGKESEVEAWRRFVEPVQASLRSLRRAINEAKVEAMARTGDWTRAALLSEALGNWDAAAWFWRRLGGRYATTRRVVGELDRHLGFKVNFRDLAAPYPGYGFLGAVRLGNPLSPAVDVLNADQRVWQRAGWTIRDVLKYSEEIKARAGR